MKSSTDNRVYIKDMTWVASRWNGTKRDYRRIEIGLTDGSTGIIYMTDEEGQSTEEFVNKFCKLLVIPFKHYTINKEGGYLEKKK